MSDGSSILIESARTYLARGYAVIPVPARKKIPVLKGWTDLRLSASDLPAHFNGTKGPGCSCVGKTHSLAPQFIIRGNWKIALRSRLFP